MSLMPPLSRRIEDIPALVDHFLRRQNGRDNVERRLSQSVLKTLCARSWPGNVRELSNEIARLAVLSDGDIVDPELVRTSASAGSGQVSNEVLTLGQIERKAIENALTATGEDKQKAAGLLGISLSKIYQRLARWKEEDEARE